MAYIWKWKKKKKKLNCLKVGGNLFLKGSGGGAYSLDFTVNHDH